MRIPLNTPSHPMDPASRTITISKLLKEWSDANRSTYSKGHLISVDRSVRVWTLPVLGDLPIDQVGTPEVLRVRAKMLDAGLSPATVNHAFRALKLLWNFAVNLGWLEKPTFKLKPLRLQRKPRVVLPAARVPEFLATVDERVQNPQVRAMLRTMVGLGMRESEVIGMRWEWFDEHARTYTVGKAKGKEARVIPVPAWVWSAIWSLPKGNSVWVFPALDGAPHRAQVTKMPLLRVCKRLGLGHLTPHRLRATFATLHAEAGTPLSDLQAMLGHKSITTTMVYIEQSLDSKRRAQEALSQKLGLA